MTSETETKTEEKKTATAKFAEWLMRRDERRQEKESNLEGMMKLQLFLSSLILVSVAGATALDYAMTAWIWL
tara:strand:+ start:279 stop:494 length:216 start_codon:yes stop_codon:yes gene_type:complete